MPIFILLVLSVFCFAEPVRVYRNAFNAGELSPLLDSRFDLAKYNNGCEILENMIVLPYGGATRRPGTAYVASTKSNGVARLIPFIAGTTEAYIIEAGNLYFRFYSNGQQILTGSTPLELATVYTESELNDIRFAQLNDVMYLFHGNHPVYKLSRLGSETFEINPVDFAHIPYQDINSGFDEITVVFDYASVSAWVTATDYEFGDMVKVTTSGDIGYFTCIRDHTSSSSNDPEITADQNAAAIGSENEYWYCFAFFDDAATDAWYYDQFIERGAPVSIQCANQDVLLDLPSGGQLQLKYYRTQTLLNDTYTADEISVPIRVFGAWNLLTSGTWNGTLDIERSFDYGKTWEKYKELESGATASAGQANFNESGDEDNENVFYRLNHDYGSGTSNLKVQFTCTDFAQSGEVLIGSTTGGGSLPNVTTLTAYSDAVLHIDAEDNAANSAVDNEKTANNGILYGGIYLGLPLEKDTADVYQTTEKKEGAGSFHLDGDGDYILLNADVATALGTGSRTFCGWFRFDAVNAQQTLIQLNNNNTYDVYAIQLNTSAKLELRFDNTLKKTGTTALVADTWYFIASTYDSTTDNHRIYINNALDISVNSDAPYSMDGTDKILIGSERTATAVFGNSLDGYLDNVLIYDRALSLTELQQITNTTYTLSGTVITPIYDSENRGVIDTTAPSTTDSTSLWAISSWNPVDGYPECGAFYDQRLVLGKNTQVWLSKTDDFENFKQGTNDDEAISITIASKNYQNIEWIASSSKLIVGMSASEWIVGGERDAPITPTNFVIRKQSQYGSENIDVLQVNDLLLYIQRQGLKVRELAYEFETDKWVSPDLTILSEHVTKSGIIQAAFQQQNHAIFWAAMNDGYVAAMTYEKEHDVIGWHRHDFGGDVESVATIPQSEVDDQLWMIVNRTINGSTVRYIEYMKPYEYQSATMTDYYFVDCGTTTEVTAATTITGLGYLEGKKVAVVADGVVLSDGYTSGTGFNVTSGSITISDENQTYTTVYVGLPFTSTIKPSKLEIANANGTLSRIKRIFKAHPQFYKTSAAKYSADGTTYYPVELTATTLYTGEKEVGLMSSFDKKQGVWFKQDQPLPMTIIGIEFEADINE